ncbi:MAG: putative thiosulfate sulfurtransferase [Methanoregula sp. PtaU1.Bin051]|nr:MAG: putative thiosulfate sulfurtransferase [Methanoregula sp. PtaU1.Bin051]
MNPFGKGDGTVRWVSTGWLSGHLKDPGLLVLDCQPNIHEYVQEHIPDAVYWHEGLFRIHEGKVPTRWIPPEAAGILFSTLGLDPARPVVVYSSSGPLTTCASFIGDGLEQTMVAYTLVRYGHRNVYVLDGGFEKWKEDGRPTTREYGVARPSSFTARVRNEFIIGYEEFLRIKDQAGVVLLDARPPVWYEGQGPWAKPGHIPGAVNLPWKSLMEDKNKKLLKPEEQIRKLAEAAGATPDKLVICSCGTGREATNEFLTFRWLLGYPKVVIFEGSFTEWISHPENPVVTGKSPR